MIPLETLYRKHIERLLADTGAVLEDVGFDTLIIHSGSIRLENRFDDRTWPLRMTPAFAHWLPLREADAYLVIEPGQTPALHRTRQQSYWDSPEPRASDHFWFAFSCDDRGAEGVRPGARAAFIGEDVAAGRALGIEDDRINPAALLQRLDDIRAHKSDYEIHCIREANRNALRGHEVVREQFCAGAHSELDLHLAYLKETGQDAWETPYGNIVALGEHAAVLHHVHYGRKPSDAGSLLVDAGATYLGYAADITRTTAKGDAPAARRFADLVSGVDRLQQVLASEVAPGIEFEDLHERAHALLAELLIDVGIASASADELVSTGATRAFFPHGLGHSLGLQVHDVGCKRRPPRPNNPYLRTTATLELGHVVTIEPGCYFIPSLLGELAKTPVVARLDWSLIDSLRPFGGIRIEDNVAISHDGTLNLTRDNGPA